MEKEIFVSINLDGEDYFLGRLWSRNKNGHETASFEYSREWLNHPKRFALEPALALMTGTQHTPNNRKLFGSLGDSAPDRWGRILMRRAERQRAQVNESTPRTLMEIDYLLQVNDETREGAVRFSLEKNAVFLSNSKASIPPLLDLPRLLSAAERFADEKDTAEDLKLLLAPGSSLGGARPKASVRDKDGHLAIAKFPSKHDEYNTVLWEAVALKLASLAKIVVPEWRIEKINSKPVLISRRFDRQGKNRIPYLSAMSMLGATDNESRSYLEIIDAIKQYGSNTAKDLSQLWRRMIFNILIANTDDHLRNHAFLYLGGNGWQLSPAFDLNPVPLDIKPRVLSTTIDFNDGTGSLALALSVAEYFDLKQPEAKRMINQIKKVVATWRMVAKSFGLSAAEMNRMASAFEYTD